MTAYLFPNNNFGLTSPTYMKTKESYAREYSSRHPEYPSQHPQYNTKLFITPTHQDFSHLIYTINNINKIVNIYNMKFYNYNYNSKTALYNRISDEALETLNWAFALP